MNTLLKLTALLILAAATGCSSRIDASLQEQIDFKSASTEELFDHYEDLNDQLVDVIEDKDYYYKKLIKAKNQFRVITNRINNRKSRIISAETPTAQKGEEVKPVDTGLVEDHREKLTEYEEELAEIQKEIDEYMTLTKELTNKSLELRTGRNKAYDAYINSRNELKMLNEKAESQHAK